MVQLEKTLWALQIKSALTPYLLPTLSPSGYLPAIQKFAKFFLIISKIVADILYVLRREDHRASRAITFLENELKRGKQCILCQSILSKSFVRPRMVRLDSDVLDFHNRL